MAITGMEARIQGRNLSAPGFALVKNMSIRVPIRGSFTASQMFHTSSMVDRMAGLTCRNTCR